MRRLSIGICMACLIGTMQLYADEVKNVPFGAGILPNGFIGETEWDSAARIDLDDAVVMYVRQDSHYLYIGIYSTDTTHTGIDLYLQSDKSCRYRLHISSAHGQSRQCDTVWTEMDYCENRWWTSNIVESIFVDGATRYMAPEIFEYQIEKTMIDGEDLKLMIHLKRPEKIVPRNATVDSIDGWFTIRL